MCGGSESNVDIVLDLDGDGVIDSLDAFPSNSAETVDTDGDGTGNNADTDDDNDGVLDTDDAFPLDDSETLDSDGDGIGNNSDDDKDNDGIPDVTDTDDDNDGVDDSLDAFPFNPNETTDTDGDGIGDNSDLDIDGDGVDNITDTFPFDPSETVDTDGDGTGNTSDTDDDNDGVLDANDAFPLNVNESVDTDGDGVGNNNDPDDDNDGIDDSIDVFPLDANEFIDTDGDGIGNNSDTDDDNDGVLDAEDAFPLDASETLDTDSDGVGNNTDTDDDGDGIVDSTDQCPLQAGLGNGTTIFGCPPIELSVTSNGYKSLTFSWVDISLASHYKILVNPDGVSGFTQKGADIFGSSIDIQLQGSHLVDWVNAKYFLEVYDSNNSLIDSSLSVSIAEQMLTSIAYIEAGDTPAVDQFGSSLMISADGNTLAVGEYNEDSNATGVNGDQGNNAADTSGAAYVFSRSGSIWAQQAYIKASNTDVNDVFGYSVSLSADGNTLAVGGPQEGSSATGINGDQNNNSAGRSGAVYVFSRSGSTWTQQAYIKASNTDAGDLFGRSLSLSADGNTLAIGAIGEDSNSSGVNGDQSNNAVDLSGAVYIFTRNGSAWTQQAYVKASNPEAFDNFGGSLSLSADGNTLAVSGPNEDSNAKGINGDQSNNSASSSGAVYLFSRSGSTWTQQAYIKASNADTNDFFGGALGLSLDGNTLAVGAEREESSATGVNGDQSNNSASSSGAVYLFSRSGSTWTQQAYVKASNTDAGDSFGESLVLSADGNYLAVGAHQEDSSATGINGDQSNNSVGNSGAVYGFSRSGSTWTQQAYVKAINTDAGDLFGRSLSLSADGNTLAAGASSVSVY